MSMTNDISFLVDRLQERDQTILDHDRQIRLLQDLVEKLRNTCVKRRDTIEALQKEKVELQKSLEATERGRNGALQRGNDLYNRTVELAIEVGKERDHIKILEVSMKNTGNRNAVLNKENAKLRHQMEENVRKYTKIIENYNTENIDLRKQLNDRDYQYAIKHKEFEAEKVKLYKEMATLKTKYHALHDEYHNAIWSGKNNTHAKVIGLFMISMEENSEVELLCSQMAAETGLFNLSLSELQKLTMASFKAMLTNNKALKAKYCADNKLSQGRG